MSLARLLEDAGPRVAGSDAETAAFDRVQAALESIRESISRSSGSGSDSPVAVEILRATHSGQFALRGPGAAVAREQTMVYTNLTSLAIRVRHRDWNPDDPVSNPAAFISAHVDTVHVSPGGFDNAANVAVAVETARAFAHGAADRPEDARAGALIVAFNSAEEDGFMGAHGVATGHPWFPSVGCALNLESMGVGGPHRMFQATRGGASDALLRVWSEAAPRPTGTVVASDIFAAGLIKSDTDHRVFRDDGDAPGFDFAFLERTEAYHTPRDRLARAREGSLQASGDNLLAFARAFAKRPPEGTTRGGVSRAEGGARRGARVAAGAKTNANDDARVDANGDANVHVNVDVNANMNAGTGPGSPAPSEDVGVTWFATPGFSRFAMYDAFDPNVGAAMIVASATTFASIARGAYLRDAASAADAARTAAAAATATVGAAAAGLVGPVAGAAAAILAAVLAGTPAPWAADKRLFFAIAVPPAIVAPAMVLAATRAALTRLKRPADEPPEVAAARRKKNDDDDDGNEDDEDGDGRARRRVTSAAYLTPDASADWTLLAATTFVASSLSAWLVRRRVASAYLVVVPAACWTAALLLAPAARVWREFAGARATLGSRALGLGSVPTPTAIATASLAPAWIAFPTYLEFAELVFGMTARSRAPPTALRGYAHDAVCGAAAGAFAFLLLPMILTLLREPQTKRDGAKSDVPASDRSRSRSRSRGEFQNAETHPFASSFATSTGLLCVAWALAIGFSTTTSSPSRGSPWTADRPLPLSVAAVSTSTGDVFVVAHPAGPGPSSAFAAAFRAAGLDVTCDDVRVDMASYAATSDAGACVIRDGALAGEMAASIPAPSLAPATPPRARLVPVRFDPGGAGRWVIAVDRSCARRVAVVPGDDAKNVPVGPWRLVALGGAGTGTGNVRYAAFGAGGGGNATKGAFVVWVETRERAGDACVGAVTARADHDVEVPAVRRVLDAAPEWVTTFAKHHTPLKAARVVVADATG